MIEQQTVLELQDLAIGYTPSGRSRIIVADSINTTLKQGQLICVLGPNGAGKSTLLRTIAGMQKPLAGRVLLSGDDVTRLSARQLATRLSVVLTEQPDVGLMTGFGVVALGRHPYTNWTGRLSEQDKAIISWAIGAVGAMDIADRPLNELSDGQRQKIMIARALAQEPDLIILDEPTAFLDLPRRVETMRLLKSLGRETGRSILLSTHDLDLALHSADRLWLMGQASFHTGVPEDLVLGGTFEAVFQSEGVNFDLRTGSFQMSGVSQVLVTLVGQGIPYVWTERALKREGFRVVSNGTASLARVEVTGVESELQWQLQRKEHQITCYSIEELLHELG